VAPAALRWDGKGAMTGHDADTFVGFIEAGLSPLEAMESMLKEPGKKRGRPKSKAQDVNVAQIEAGEAASAQQAAANPAGEPASVESQDGEKKGTAQGGQTADNDLPTVNAAEQSKVPTRMAWTQEVVARTGKLLADRNSILSTLANSEGHVHLIHLIETIDVALDGFRAGVKAPATPEAEDGPETDHTLFS